MNWRIKSGVQKAVAALPPGIGNPLYYQLQRVLGRMRNRDVIGDIEVFEWFRERIETHGASFRNATVFEVGTGQSAMMSLLCHAFGARHVTTMDVNRLLRRTQVQAELEAAMQRKNEVIARLGVSAATSLELALLAMRDTVSLEELLSATGIDYLAPADASKTSLPDASIDLHVSNSVLEHIRADALPGILREANRILKSETGLFIHRIDMSDHRAHWDGNIARIDFLRYSHQEWERICGNRYAYHNRLRSAALIEEATGAGLRVVSVERRTDPRTVKELETGFPLHPDFGMMPRDEIVTDGLWLIARSCDEKA